MIKAKLNYFQAKEKASEEKQKEKRAKSFIPPQETIRASSSKTNSNISKGTYRKCLLVYILLCFKQNGVWSITVSACLAVNFCYGRLQHSEASASGPAKY